MYFKLILLCFFVIGTSFSLAKNSELSKLIKSDAIEGSGHDKDLESSGSGMHPLDTDDEDAHHHTEIKTKSNTFDNHPHHSHREDDEDDIDDDDDDMSEGSGDFAFEKTAGGHIESEKTKSKSTDEESINRYDNNGQNAVNRQNSSGVFVVSGSGSGVGAETGTGTDDKHMPTQTPSLPLSSPQPQPQPPSSPNFSNKDIRLDVTNTINDLNSYQEQRPGGSNSGNGGATPAEGTGGGSSSSSSSSSSDSVLINSNLPTNTKNIDHSNTITNNNIDNNNKNNDISIMNPSDERTSFFAQPGILAAIIGGTVVGLLCAILVVMFIVYRMRKKDEGSYALHNEPKRSPTLGYAKCTNREFFA